MIGKIILGVFVALEIAMSLVAWGNPRANVGLNSLLGFFLDVGIVAVGVIIW
jgi:hypothetical protein